jgi:hypothetical protein
MKIIRHLGFGLSTPSSLSLTMLIEGNWLTPGVSLKIHS